MTCTTLKTRVTVLSLAFAATACATPQSQQPRAPVEGYNAPATYAYATPSRPYTPPASNYGTDGEAMLLNVIFLRPVSLIGSAVGAAAWIVSLPFSVPSRSAGEAWDALVETPLNYTFSRPLGDISSCRAADPGCRYPPSW